MHLLGKVYVKTLELSYRLLSRLISVVTKTSKSQNLGIQRASNDKLKKTQPPIPNSEEQKNTQINH